MFDIDDPPKSSYIVADGPIVDRSFQLKMFKMKWTHTVSSKIYA